MDIKELLEEMKTGTANIRDARKVLEDLLYEDLGYVKLDHHRKLRSGFGETVFCQGKPDAYLLEIHRRFYERNGEVLGTRATGERLKLVQSAVPGVAYGPISRIPKMERPGKEGKGLVAIYTDGMADIPVAEKTAQTAEYLGCTVDRIFDVGVAGIRGLLSQRDRIMKANCIIVVMGMEGILGTMIAGLIDCSVITVPTSMNYGASLHGLLALLAMLNSYANGTSVVNIDNGYEAGYLATQISRLAIR